MFFNNKTHRNNWIIQEYLKGKSTRQIANKVNLNRSTVSAILNSNKIPRRTLSEIHRKYKINENCFKTIDTEWKAYFLGLFCADGCVNKRNIEITLQTSDSYILKKLSSFIYPDNAPPLFYKKPYSKKYKNGVTINSSGSARLTVCNKNIYADIANLGIARQKSLTLNFPTAIPDNLLHHFVRGYFDGDGGVRVSNNSHALYILASNNFCNSLSKFLIKKTNVKSKIEKKGKISVIKITNAKDILILYTYMYQNATFFLDRKQNRFLALQAKVQKNINHHRYRECNVLTTLKLPIFSHRFS